MKLYYQAVDVLERYGVAWQAIQEDYETLTAGGRMKVNIMLSVAENEADRTAERIKVVFDRKIANGECINPGGLPMGYSVERKRIVPNNDAPIVQAAFEHYDKTGSIRDTLYYLGDKLGVQMLYKSLSNMLKNRLYIGEYRENTSYCEPIIDRELFERVQVGLKSRSIRHNPSDRVYIFSGLIVCGECGRKMVGVYHNNGGDTQHYNGYRCPRAYQSHVCEHRKFYSERKLEAALLDYVSHSVAKSSAIQPAAKVPQKKTVDPAKIKAKVDRLKDLYVDGLIDKAQYLADRERLEAPLKTVEFKPSPRQTTAYSEIAREDFPSRYGTLSASEKRDLWRSALNSIVIDAQGTVQFYFAW